MQTENTHELLTENEASAFMRLTKLSLWRWRKRGELPFIKIGGKMLYRKSDLIAFLEARTHNRNLVVSPLPQPLEITKGD